MIITKVSGGLGNQLFQYAIARSLAIRNNDICALDIQWYENNPERTFDLDFFPIQATIATQEQIDLLRGKETLTRRIAEKLGMPLSRPNSYMLEKEPTVFDEDVFKATGDIYLDGCWQNERYFKDIRKILLKECAPKKSIDEHTVSLYKENIDQKENAVSIHIRRGDYVTVPLSSSVHGFTGMAYYERAMQRVKELIKNPHFYIFSDDIEWCKTAFASYENCTFVDMTTHAIDDIILMKSCKHAIIANSTFSWWGAWLIENPEKVVISPRIWFAKFPSRHITPKRWIKI